MNDAPARKSHALTWTVSALGVLLLLYAATWPVVEINSRRYEVVTTGPFSYAYLNDKSTPRLYRRVVPRWVDLLYRPMVLLRDLNDGDNPVSRYYTWWWAKLEAFPNTTAP